MQLPPARMDVWGRCTHCLWCGARLRPHPNAGRPRKFCQKAHGVQYVNFRKRRATVIKELLDLTHSIALKASTEFERGRTFHG